jgi:hypothetical protein
MHCHDRQFGRRIHASSVKTVAELAILGFGGRMGRMNRWSWWFRKARRGGRRFGRWLSRLGG